MRRQRVGGRIPVRGSVQRSRAAPDVVALVHDGARRGPEERSRRNRLLREVRTGVRHLECVRARAVSVRDANRVQPAREADATGHVLVGIDGSPASVRALGFAFDHASRHNLALTVVHTWEVPPIGAITGVPSPEPPTLLQNIADNELRASSEELAGYSESYPDVPVDISVVQGSPLKVLAEKSSDADLLVVGSRGRGGFLGLLLGSVSHGVLHHAHCPVAVVRGEK